MPFDARSAKEEAASDRASADTKKEAASEKAKAYTTTSDVVEVLSQLRQSCLLCRLSICDRFSKLCVAFYVPFFSSGGLSVEGFSSFFAPFRLVIEPGGQSMEHL